jgi:hypothetical protein
VEEVLDLTDLHAHEFGAYLLRAHPEERRHVFVNDRGAVFKAPEVEVEVSFEVPLLLEERVGKKFPTEKD